MPRIQDVTGENPPTGQEPVSMPTGRPSTQAPIPSVTPEFSPLLRSPLPGVTSSSPDSLRQFYRSGLPQMRIPAPAPVATGAGAAPSAAGTTSAATRANAANVAAAVPPSGGGGGSVTSVGLTMPAEFSVAGSPVTGAGTIGVTKAVQNANKVYAGPNTGADAAPTFRALVGADLPAGVVTSFPGAGLVISTGSGWGASLTETDGSILYGSGGNWTKGTALPNGITATTQALADNSTKVATTAYSDRGILGKQFNGTPGTLSDGMFPQYQSASGKIEQAWVYQKLTGEVEGVPVSGQKMMPDFNVTQPMAFAANFAGSQGSLNKRFGVNPTATATLSVVRTTSGVETTIGTISISTSGVLTFATTGGVAQSAGSGDVISVYNQNPADATLAYVSFTLVAYLGSSAPTLPVTSGSVSGPVSSVVNNVLLWDSTNGTQTKDSGVHFDTSTALGGGDTASPTALAAKTYVDAHYFSSQNDVHASRTGGTVYRNTTGRPMKVNVMLTSTSTTYATAWSDASTPPTTTVAGAIQQNAGSALWVMPFIVLPNNYYKVAPNAGTPTTLVWIETY